jgi:signal transduction histidine kinase
LKAADLSRATIISELLHELRTPLSALRSSIDNLLAGVFGALTSEQKLKLEKMVTQIERIDGMISRVHKSAQKELKLKKTLLSRIVSDAFDSVEHLLDENSITTEIDVPQELEIYVDASMIEQAIVNILTNAARYAGYGASVTISAEKEDESVLIRIYNTGEPIPEEEMEKIFEENYRLPKHSNIEGSGLGLPIAKKIVESHGGKIWVEPCGGKGAMFCIRLPLR